MKMGHATFVVVWDFRGTRQLACFLRLWDDDWYQNCFGDALHLIMGSFLSKSASFKALDIAYVSLYQKRWITFLVVGVGIWVAVSLSCSAIGLVGWGLFSLTQLRFFLGSWECFLTEFEISFYGILLILQWTSSQRHIGTALFVFSFFLTFCVLSLLMVSLVNYSVLSPSNNVYKFYASGEESVKSISFTNFSSCWIDQWSLLLDIYSIMIWLDLLAAI